MTTDEQFRRFGMFVTGVMDAHIYAAKGEHPHLVVAAILMGADRYGIEFHDPFNLGEVSDSK